MNDLLSALAEVIPEEEWQRMERNSTYLQRHVCLELFVTGAQLKALRDAVVRARGEAPGPLSPEEHLARDLPGFVGPSAVVPRRYLAAPPSRQEVEATLATYRAASGEREQKNKER